MLFLCDASIECIILMALTSTFIECVCVYIFVVLKKSIP